MPDLIESLQGRDLGHLHIIASLWGVELDRQDLPSALLELSSSILTGAMTEKIVSSLSSEARAAIEVLIRHNGRLPWAQFTRTYGEVREMGTAKRDREQPYAHPVSAVEVLWYRGIIAQAFFDTPGGPEEFAYIPGDLLELMLIRARAEGPQMGRQASAPEYTCVSQVNDRILDHSCTLMAAMRLGINPPPFFESGAGEELSGDFIKSLLSASNMLNKAGELNPEPVRVFLEASRGEAIVQLYHAWKESPLINELLWLPGLAFEGNWVNDPLESRRLVLGYISNIPTGVWWNLTAFISAIKQRNPDFQRPGGDYDSWFIRNQSNGEYLRGFEHWDEVDGRLIRYILTGPLHWLGVLDLAGSAEGDEVSAFRLSGWSKALLKDMPPKGLAAEHESLVVRSDARVSAKRLVPRRVRYQVARFCDWVKETPEEYQYQINPASLQRAKQQGLTVSQLVSLLNRSAKAIPPSLLKALEQWDAQGTEARLEEMLVLRVVSEDILQLLRKSRASRFLGESLGPTTIAVKQGAVDKVLGVLAELGYLGEVRESED